MPRPWKTLLWFTHTVINEDIDRVKLTYGPGSTIPDTALLDRSHDYRIAFDVEQDRWRLDIRAV